MDKPEYIPIPRTGTKCPYCWLSRSGIYNLISSNKANGDKAVVKSTKVRLPGRKGGRRMVHYESLMSYLNSKAVPVEMLNLRKAWRKFRAQPKDANESAPVDIGGFQFLTEQEADTLTTDEASPQ